MARTYVRLSSRIDFWKNQHNVLVNNIGDMALLTTSGEWVTGSDSDLVHAINEVDYRLDSINDNSINSPHLHMRDSASLNTIKGNLNLHKDLDVKGNVQIDGTLTVDGVVNFKAGSSGSVTLGDTNTDNVIFNADINSNLRPNTNNAFDIGASGLEWRHLWVTGNGNIDHLIADSADISGTLAVGGNVSVNTNKFTVAAATGNTAIAGTLDVTGATGVDGNFDVATNKFTVAAATGNTAIAGTLGVTGAVTANAGVNIDNINIDGTTINLSSGDLTVSAAGDLYLKPTGDDVWMQGVTTGEQLKFTLGTTTQTIAASDALTLTGSTFTVDASGDINLDADGGDVVLKDGGTTFGQFTQDGTQLKISSQNGQWLKFTGSGVRLNGVIADSDLSTASKNITGSINELFNAINALSDSSGAGLADLLSSIGDLTTLTTTAQDNLVNAINEVDAKAPDSDAVRGYFSATTSGTGYGGLTYNSSNGTFTYAKVTDANIRERISATTSGTGYGGLTYASATGILTFAKVTDADIRGRFTGGNAITYTSSTGTIAVTSNAIQADELAVSGNGTSGQALISDGDGTFSWGRKVPNIYDSDGTLLN